jgi:hypothetical protein
MNGTYASPAVEMRMFLQCTIRRSFKEPMTVPRLPIIEVGKRGAWRNNEICAPSVFVHNDKQFIISGPFQVSKWEHRMRNRSENKMKVAPDRLGSGSAASCARRNRDRDSPSVRNDYVIKMQWRSNACDVAISICGDKYLV